ncbi:MAG: hypothetical protein AB7G75_07570 [Candidatus Binatia bacterium]
MLLQRLSPKIRLMMIQARSRAMKGDLPVALNEIDRSAECKENHQESFFDLIALVLLKSELLYLDGQEKESVEVFRVHLQPRLKDLPEEFRFVLEDNLTHVRLALFEGTAATDFYRLVDRQRLAKFELSDTSRLIAAQEAASQDKHFDAVHYLWTELVRTFQFTSWRSYERASQQLAAEYLTIGFLTGAAYYSVMALDLALAAKVGDSLVRSRHREAVAGVVRKLLQTANLQRHFTVACEIISHLGDAVPRDLSQPVVDWLVKRASVTPTTLSIEKAYAAVWKAIAAITPILNADQAKLVVHTATQHEFWKDASPKRENMVRVVNSCVSVLPETELQDLTNQALPLAGEAKHAADYRDTINLLCHLAQRGGEELREGVKQALYPNGISVGPILIEAAPLFGKKLIDADQLTRVVDRVAETIRLQVQLLDAGQKSQPVIGSMMVFTHGMKDGRKLEVHARQPFDLRAIAAHRHALPSEKVESLITSMLEMVDYSENFLSNRASLIDNLVLFGDCLSQQCLDRIFVSLSPLAQGKIIEPSYSQSAEAQNPLNRFRINLGTPAEVQQIALYTLARLDTLSQSFYGKKLYPLIETGLSSSIAEVRRASLAAIRELSKIPRSFFMAALLGTRDSDPTAAAIAYEALAVERDLSLIVSDWHLLIYSLENALQSSEAKVRRTAALAGGYWLTKAKKKLITEHLSQLQQTFAHDICWSVRKTAGALA